MWKRMPKINNVTEMPTDWFRIWIPFQSRTEVSPFWGFKNQLPLESGKVGTMTSNPQLSCPFKLRDTPVRSSMCTPSSMMSLIAWSCWGNCCFQQGIWREKIDVSDNISHFAPQKNNPYTHMWVGCPETNSKSHENFASPPGAAQHLQILILLMQELPSTSAAKSWRVNFSGSLDWAFLPPLKKLTFVSEAKQEWGVSIFDTRKNQSPRSYYKKEAAEGCRLV